MLALKHQLFGIFIMAVEELQHLNLQWEYKKKTFNRFFFQINESYKQKSRQSLLVIYIRKLIMFVRFKKKNFWLLHSSFRVVQVEKFNFMACVER